MPKGIVRLYVKAFSVSHVSDISPATFDLVVVHRCDTETNTALFKMEKEEEKEIKMN